MKQVLSLLFVIVTLLSYGGEIMSNPIYAVKIIITSCDISSITNICNHYNYSFGDSSNNELTFSNPEGDKITVSYDRNDEFANEVKVQKVVMHFKKKSVKIEKMLEDGGFIKSANGYTLGNVLSNSYILCTISKDKSLTLSFQRVNKKRNLQL